MPRSAADIRIEPVRPGDVDRLLGSLRKCDIREARAMVGEHNVEAEIRRTVGTSAPGYVAWASDKMICIFGVVPLSIVTGRGMPWLLGTDEMERHPGAVMRISSRYIRGMAATFSHLSNHVDARNTRSVKWLRRLGFTVHEPEPFGPYGAPFHRFEMGA